MNEEERILDRDLRKFGNTVDILIALEQGERITPIEAYKKIKELFKSLKQSKRSLFPKEKTNDTITNQVDKSGEGYRTTSE